MIVIVVLLLLAKQNMTLYFNNAHIIIEMTTRVENNKALNKNSITKKNGRGI